MTGQNSRPGPSNINIDGDSNFSESDSPSIYFYRYPSITTSEAEASLNLSPGAEFSATRPGQSNSISPRSPSFISPPLISDPPSEQQTPFRQFPNLSYTQEFDLDREFSQSNVFLKQQGQTPLPPSLDRDSVSIQDDGKSRSQLSSLYRNNRTIPMLNPSSLYHSYDINSGTQISYCPVDTNIPVSRYEFEAQRGGWSYGPSSSDEIHSEINMVAPCMSTNQENQASYFYSREEIPTSSPMLPLRCDLCEAPTSFENENHYHLHYWDEHPPPPGSSEGWLPRRCLWDECTFGKEFLKSRTWVDHAYIVHYRRFPCTFEGCTFTKAFGNRHSLARHISTMHKEPELCKIRGCQGNKTKLCRKDKKTEHNANFHGPLVCMITGCPRGRIDDQDHGFSDPNELNKHMQKKHRFLRSRETVFDPELSKLD